MDNDRQANEPETKPASTTEPKNSQPPAADARDETILDPDTRVRDVLIGPDAARRLE